MTFYLGVEIREGEMGWVFSLYRRELKSTYIFSWKNLRSETDHMGYLSVEYLMIRINLS
jgi:hypothetical protein